MLDPAAVAARLAERFDAQNESWTTRHIALSEIPAPAYAEAARGAALADLFRAAGLDAVATDAVGNVLGRLPHSRGPLTVVSAHLDTVFGPETAVTVRREGPILRGPGISDDAAGLIMLPALAEALAPLAAELGCELWFVATVGEESLGNLRGARHLAAHGLDHRPLAAFLTLDTSTPGQVVRHGTHTVNHDLTLTGPGGHAWGDFGVVSPSLTLARILARVSDYPAPLSPRTTFNCGVLTAGLAPNAIPQSARGHLNLRSEDGGELAKLVAYAERVATEELEIANSQRRHGPELRLERTVTARPGGETAAHEPLIRAAVAAAQRLDRPISHPYSSTDANAFYPNAIPAVCLYRGVGGGEHTPAEWYDASTRPEALTQIAETILRFGQLVAGR